MQSTRHTPKPWTHKGVFRGKQYRQHIMAGDIHVATIEPAETAEARDANCDLVEAAPDLLEACQQILWKLSHNTSPSGNGGDCRPGTVDRTDATIRMAQAAVNRALGID